MLAVIGKGQTFYGRSCFVHSTQTSQLSIHFQSVSMSISDIMGRKFSVMVTTWRIYLKQLRRTPNRPDGAWTPLDREEGRTSCNK